MTRIYKSAEGERAVRERYLEFLKYWPVPNQQLRVPTREGETFIVACGDENAPPLVLLHGAAANSAMWMGDVAAWAAHFRVYAVDLIGEAGLSAPSRPPLASEAHALWLDDVMQALSLARASIVGRVAAAGGWRWIMRLGGRNAWKASLCFVPAEWAVRKSASFSSASSADVRRLGHAQGEGNDPRACASQRVHPPFRNSSNSCRSSTRISARAW